MMRRDRDARPGLTDLCWDVGSGGEWWCWEGKRRKMDRSNAWNIVAENKAALWSNGMLFVCFSGLGRI